MSARLNSSQARDIAYYLHPYTNLSVHEKEGPLVITRGEGIYIYDDAGKRYIEGLGGLWCTSLGFNEERLIEAAIRQMRKLPYYHAFGHKSMDVGIELAEKLIALAPVPMSKVFFTNSGSEANDTAVKLIWYYHNAIGKPAKKKIIARIKGYHGVTVAAASLTGLPHLHRDFDLPIAGILHTDCPHHYRFGKPGESEEEFATRCAESLEQLILKEGPETVAAFFAEPVMGAGGVIVPPRTYFEKVQAVLKKYDVLFVADEVICGFGRTGNMFGVETYKLRPDFITIAKQLSSAYLPIAGLMIAEKVYRAMVKESEKIGTFGHGYTYGGHPVSAAVALETLKIYEERDIVGHVRRVAPRLQEGLRQLAKHPIVGEARGVGLIGGLELVKDKATREPFQPADGVGAYAAKRAQEHGVITRAMGDSLGFSPPLIITESQIDDMLARVGKALDETHAWLRERQLVAA
ncbi:MAG TPA: aspartate aminotransferase family protein [Alphaproteobacteria bacterium]|nr:aspartate aminotransferase family protein [Alphaproteobacteria bacterium]